VPVCNYALLSLATAAPGRFRCPGGKDPTAVVTGGYDGVIRVWDLEQAGGGGPGADNTQDRLLSEIQGHAAAINSLVLDSSAIKL